jgi:hypothetical protein
MTGRACLHRLSGPIALGSLVIGVTGITFLIVGGVRGWVPFGDPGTAENTVVSAIFVIAFPILGWVVLRRQPSNRLGLVYLAIGFWEALNMLASGYSTFAFWTAGGNLPLAPELSWVGVWAWVPAFTLFSTLGILLFPTGRLPSRRWWPVVLVTAIAFVLLLVPSAILAWPYRGVPIERSNALNLPPPTDSGLALAFAIQNVAQLVLLAAMVGSVAGLVVRFRRSSRIERQQLKWFASAAVLDVIVIVLWSLGVFGSLIGAVSAVVFALALPVAIGIAILRYRLYDIDRIISRTLAYAVLTAILAAVYLAGFLGLQSVLAPFTANGGPVAVAASTLVVFVLFQPVRRRIQAAVDRRFYRSRYDAAREIENFAARVRDEVEVDRLAVALSMTLERTMQPASASIWLRSGAAAEGAAVGGKS